MADNELDPAQKLAEDARKELAEHHTKQQQMLHNLATNMVKGFKEPEYQPGELAVEQKKAQGTPTPPTKKVNSNVGAFLDLGDHKISITGVPVIDIAAVMTYIFTTVLADDPRIEKILRKAKIQLLDIEGNLIFPPNNKTKKKKSA